MIERDLKPKLIQAMKNFRIVALNGPRQSGKTTLVKQIAQELNLDYITFDDGQILDFAISAPKEFLTFYAKNPVVIDEIQYCKELIPYLKQFVDDKNQKGMFLLTGSADIINMSQVVESLAGRMVTYYLYPLSNKEINVREQNIVDLLFNDAILDIDLDAYQSSLEDILTCITRGGYPEVLELDESFRNDWFKSYIEARITKDILNIKTISNKKIELFPKLIKILSAQTGQLLNIDKIAKKLQIDNKTVKSYIEILKAMYIVKPILPYFSNKTLTLIKTEKLHFIDTAIPTTIQNINEEQLLLNKDKEYGSIIENAIYCEILKQQTVAQTSINIYHYRDLAKKEVDLILASSLGEIVPCEIKAKSIIKKSDLKGMLEVLRNYKNIRNGFVIYIGDEIRPMKIEEFFIYLIPMKIFF